MSPAEKKSKNPEILDCVGLTVHILGGGKNTKTQLLG